MLNSFLSIVSEKLSHTHSSHDLFQGLSEDWWNETGPMRPLHELNPTRIRDLRDRIVAHMGKENTLEALKDVSILDIGCGGGLVCESLNRLGAKVTGIDSSENAISAAKAHASSHDLDIQYHAATSTQLIETQDTQYDVVTALELIEHVVSPENLIKDMHALCKPGGLVMLSTLNRNPASFALGIIAAEYILRWVPRGTHDWRQFIKPSELSQMLEKQGFELVDTTGLTFDPIAREYRLSKRLDVNYFITAKKP